MRKPSPHIGLVGTMSSPSASPEISRRRFLFALSAGSAGAVAVAASPALATGAVAATDAGIVESSGYRETDHIRDYYASTRL